MEFNIILFVIAYLVMVNLCGFVLCGMDKKKARRGQWRIPEKRFFIIAAVGGGVGVLMGMYKFRHKTKHKSFTIGIPAIIAIEYNYFAILQIICSKIRHYK